MDSRDTLEHRKPGDEPAIQAARRGRRAPNEMEHTFPNITSVWRPRNTPFLRHRLQTTQTAARVISKTSGTWHSRLKSTRDALTSGSARNPCLLMALYVHEAALSNLNKFETPHYLPPARVLRYLLHVRQIGACNWGTRMQRARPRVDVQYPSQQPQPTVLFAVWRAPCALLSRQGCQRFCAGLALRRPICTTPIFAGMRTPICRPLMAVTARVKRCDRRVDHEGCAV